jgi:hypothetical protein
MGMKESILYASKFSCSSPSLLLQKSSVRRKNFFMFTSSPWSVVKEEAEVDGNRKKISKLSLRLQEILRSILIINENLF